MDQESVARKWLTGKGIEIGAFTTPIPGIRPYYVDRFRRFANVDCHADVFADGAQLPFRTGSLDYVATSHVLEHTANPIAALCEWRRVLRVGGILYVVVPDKRYTWDHRRATTSWQHMLEDYRRRTTDCDETHVDEFLDNVDWPTYSPQTKPEEVDAERTRRKNGYRSNIARRAIINIHFHVFDPENTVTLFENLSANPLTRLGLSIVATAERFPDENPNGFLVVARATERRSRLLDGFRSFAES
jgi:SAM-dependent methyltransferase